MSTAVARGAEDAVRRVPDFVIVGTSRSGTTLVQRLACGLDGVRVPPETHFRLFMWAMSERRSFPLDEMALREELAWYSARKTSNGLALDVDAIVDDLGGACSDPWDLFSCLVSHLAGPAEIVGEKTPEHVRWWPALTARFPRLKVICVVREPRAVVASNLGVPFAPKSHVLIAERWAAEQAMVRRAREVLPRARCLVLRYEDVVADPGSASEAIARLLRTRPVPTAVRADDLFHGWEWWKERALAPITTDRVDAWAERLTPRQAARVLSICRPHLAAFGYAPRPGRATALAWRATIRPHDHARVRVFRSAFAQEMALVDRWSR